jgi:hypothetical protein
MIENDNPMILGSGKKGVETREHKCFVDNMKDAAMDSIVILAVYTIAVAGRRFRDKNAFSAFASPDIYIWMFLFFAVGTFLKTCYPRCEDNLINVAVLHIFGILMIPMTTS